MLNCIATYRSRDKKPGGNKLNDDGAIGDSDCSFSTCCSPLCTDDQKSGVSENVNNHSDDEESEVNDIMIPINTASESYEFDY